MIRRPPRSTLSSSSAASDVYKRQESKCTMITSTHMPSMLLPIPEEHAFREDTGGGVLGFFSQEELILAGLDASNDSETAEHPCDAEIIAGPAQCEQELQTWSFPLRHQVHCRAPTATDKLKAKYGPSGSFTYSYAGQGRGRRDPPCSKPRVRNPAKRKLHPRTVLQQEGSTSTMEDYADDVPQTLQVIIIAKGSVHQRPGHGTRSHRGAFLARLGAAKRSACLLYTSPSPRDKRQSRMPSSA